VNKAVAAEFTSKFPARPGIFTIDQLGLGGWDRVQKRFFDPKTGILARIERQVGGVTG
jgi:ABC-type sulfate transport system substrate-binding protein